jgi:hypothetical protein
MVLVAEPTRRDRIWPIKLSQHEHNNIQYIIINATPSVSTPTSNTERRFTEEETYKTENVDRYKCE